MVLYKGTIASILGVSFTMHRFAHVTHHRETNVEGKDPDLAYTDSSLFSLSIDGVLALLQAYQDYFGWLVHQPYGETARYKNTNTFLSIRKVVQ
jgi:fatty acid desaturase